jgi:hypothetical protein
MRGMRFTLMLLVSAAATAATVYKWVDENGVTHYSDTPHENASTVQVPEAQTYTPAPVAASTPSIAPGQSAPNQTPPYSACSLTEPIPDQVYFNTFTVTARLAVTPSQRSGDQVVLTLDGKPLTNLPTSGLSFTISPVDRGSHSLQATIQDGNGQAVCQSSSVTFHVRQPSVQAPHPANRPRF